jgi:protein TonB
LSKWRFKPATRGGDPEESWRVMSVRFEIENQ